MHFLTPRILIVLTVFLFLASACATHRQQPERDADTTANREKSDIPEVNASGSRNEVPASVDSALLPEEEKTEDSLSGNGVEPKSEQDPRFDVRANEVPARQFFMSLVSETLYSLTVHPEVEGTITLQMQDATLPQVLNAVRNLHGYPYRRTGAGYQILPAGTVSRTFHVSYLDLTRQGGSQTQVRSGSVSQNADDGGGSRSVTSTEISTESESAFWSELESSLTSIVGQGKDRRVITQPQAGLVVVRALPRELEQVERYLDTMRQNVRRQVILEAKIMEVRLNKGHQTGINWSGLLSGSESGAVISQTGGGSVISEGTAQSRGNSLDLGPNNPDLSTGRAARAFGGMFSAAVNIRNFTAFVEFLRQQGEVNVLSSPRVATMNNQKAVIKVGTDRFYVTDVSTETDTVGTTTDETQISDVTLDPFFSGIALDVTPSISRRGLVTMHIHPSVSDVTEEQKSLQLAGNQIALPLAQSEVRESDTLVKARDGQVVVIGGLMKTRMSEETASVPLLGDLPLLGRLFRHEKQVKEKSELVILLRPKVIESGRKSRRLPESGDLGSEGFGRQWRGGQQ
ncbi:MAG: pilus (MSHA type) biogenesis protein MshL [Desulfohalobiaceae bacterium]